MLESKFHGRSIIEKPGCPFCSSLLERPGEGHAGDMPAGSCSCGAVYVCDVTGHNLGAALVELIEAKYQKPIYRPAEGQGGGDLAQALKAAGIDPYSPGGAK